VIVGGQLRIALRFTVREGVVIGLDAIADPERLAALEVTVLPG
jgi:RNA polymerase sigma-70 factor (ECF subfamily)